MARYKTQLTIYIKESWKPELKRYAAMYEEDLSNYIQRAIDFQMKHDRKEWLKTHPKENETKSIEEQIKAVGLDLTQDQFESLIETLVEVQKTRTAVKIAKTKIFCENEKGE